MSDQAAVSTIPLAPAVSNGSVKSPNRGSIQSVDRALSLLEALAEAGGEASLTDLSRQQTTLEAAQKSFAQTSSLSLFKFL